MNRESFDKKNYGRAIWGPPMWYLIHKISYGLPENVSISEQQLLMKYYSLLVYLIPCPYCAHHFQTAMKVKVFSKSIATRQSTVAWFRTLHNEINETNKKRVLSDMEIDALYKNTLFDYKSVHFLINYLYNRVVSGHINRIVFIHWFLMTLKIFPCPVWKSFAINYFLTNDIEQNRQLDDHVVKTWLDRFFQGVGMPAIS
jgi:hypothetical protein